MIDFDALRAANPLLGFAVFAYEPGGPVTLEVKTPLGEHLPFTAPTLADACALVWPAPVPPPATPQPVTVDMFE